VANPIAAYLAKAKTYLSPDYWKKTREVHGADGVYREINRIVFRRNVGQSERQRHVDLSEVTSDPIEALYLVGVSDPVVIPGIHVPMGSLRHQRLGVRIDDEVSNPFTRSVLEYRKGSQTTYRGSALEHFFRSWQPRNAGEFLGLGPDGLSSLLSMPMQSDLLPWEPSATAEELRVRREALELKRLAKFGEAPGGYHGHDYFGPVSESLGEYRFNKHCEVADLMAHESLQGHVIEVQVLAAGSSWALLVRDGRHRTAALAVLGLDEVPVYMPQRYPIIQRESVESWPGVTAGVFTVEQAVTVFDRFLEGEPPSGLTLPP